MKLTLVKCLFAPGENITRQLFGLGLGLAIVIDSDLVAVLKVMIFCNNMCLGSRRWWMNEYNSETKNTLSLYCSRGDDAHMSRWP